MNEKRLSFMASEDVIRILEAKQVETGAGLSELIRRAVRKAYAQPAPVEKRNVQPVLLARREDETR